MDVNMNMAMNMNNIWNYTVFSRILKVDLSLSSLDVTLDLGPQAWIQRGGGGGGA